MIEEGVEKVCERVCERVITEERGRGVEGGEGLREGGVREGERMC